MVRMRQPWAIEQKELEAKGFKFNDKGELIDDVKKEEPIKKEVKKGIGKYVKDKIKKPLKSKKRGK